MKILVMTGPLFPHMGNNANLLFKVLRHMSKNNEIRILSLCACNSGLPDEVEGYPVYWSFPVNNYKRKLIYPLIAKLVDRNGYSDYVQLMQLKDDAVRIKKAYDYDAVISTSEPFPAAYASGLLNSVPKILYIMDPPACISGGKGTAYRNRNIGNLILKQDCILTTPFIKKALSENDYDLTEMIPLGFPMIDGSTSVKTLSDNNDGKIHLLYCGWLYSDIRSPEYFLKIIERLDERFTITFMGKECEQLHQRFHIHTNAEIITLPQQPYQKALEAMRTSDILINIGNSIPVHMPSKTLEYINTGKPFVNFYKMEDCPTLYYTKRYPLCLNLYEGDEDIDKAADTFIDFCLCQKGNTVDRAYIESEYEDCTPEYIAKVIMDKLGENNG